MKNIKIIEVLEPKGNTTEHVIIDLGNGEYTSMTKAHYDEMIAAQSTPIVTEDEE